MRAPLGGTWVYLPLEVRDGAAPGPGLDLWALGIVLCELAAGTHPFLHARTRYDMSAGLTAARNRLRADAHQPTNVLWRRCCRSSRRAGRRRLPPSSSCSQNFPSPLRRRDFPHRTFAWHREVLA